jgi:hypothetical protein
MKAAKSGWGRGDGAFELFNKEVWAFWQSNPL